MIIMIFRLRSGGYIGHPIMFLSLGQLWPQVVQQQLLALIRQVEVKMLVKQKCKWNESASGKRGGTIEGGGTRASTCTSNLLPTFKFVVENFQDLLQNYQKVWIEKLWSL